MATAADIRRHHGARGFTGDLRAVDTIKRELRLHRDCQESEGGKSKQECGRRHQLLEAYEKYGHTFHIPKPLSHNAPEDPPKDARSAQLMRQKHEFNGCTVINCDALQWSIRRLAELGHAPVHHHGGKVCGDCRP